MCSSLLSARIILLPVIGPYDLVVGVLTIRHDTVGNSSPVLVQVVA